MRSWKECIMMRTYVSWLSRRLSACFPSSVTTKFEACADPFVLWRKLESTAIGITQSLELTRQKKSRLMKYGHMFATPFGDRNLNLGGRCHMLQLTKSEPSSSSTTCCISDWSIQMASSVFYKFSSRKDESRVTFDGTGISVFDLKREIILANNMGKANDFDLHIFDATSKQGKCSWKTFSLYLPVLPAVEHKDDSQIIPRSSSVIVKRLPAARPGKGKASMYLAGTPQSLPLSEPVLRGSSINSGTTYHKGAMSKRFDGKDEQQSVSKPPLNVSLFNTISI